MLAQKTFAAHQYFERQSELCEHFLLDSTEVLQKLLTLSRGANHKHFHLTEDRKSVV